MDFWLRHMLWTLLVVIWLVSFAWLLVVLVEMTGLLQAQSLGG